MLITRTSRISGETRAIDLPVTDQQLADYAAGGFLQDVFRDLLPWQREFIKSGVTDEEWQDALASLGADDEPDDFWDDDLPD